jgi:hypothetical protein
MSGSTEYLHEDVTVAQGWRVDGSYIELKAVVMRLSLGLLEGGEPCAHGGEIGWGRRVVGGLFSRAVDVTGIFDPTSIRGRYR